MDQDPIYKELQDVITEACHIYEDIPETVDPDGALIGPDSALGLDSLDAVEIVVAIQKHYDVRIGGEQSGREALESLRTLADYIKGASA